MSVCDESYLSKLGESIPSHNYSTGCGILAQIFITKIFYNVLHNSYNITYFHACKLHMYGTINN